MKFFLEKIKIKFIIISLKVGIKMFSIFKKKEKVVSLPQLQFSPNYSNDFQFLYEFISRKVEAESLRITLHDVKVMSDNDCIELITKISTDILDHLSSSYKKTLENYLTDEGVVNLIIDEVTLNVIRFSLSHNGKNFMSN